jgi:hypothetical protein
MTTELPDVKDNVYWYHKVMAVPVKVMTALGIGPFGGTLATSAILEKLIAHQKGEDIELELSKSETFVLAQIEKEDDLSAILEYRDTNMQLQDETLRRWGDENLGVIWIGAGLITPHYPLFEKRKPNDWHFWTDKHPKVVKTAEDVFNEMRMAGASAGLSYDVFLPRDVEKINRIIQFAVDRGCTHLVFNCYGFIYALTPQENYEWLRQLKIPAGIDAIFIVNAPNERLLPVARRTAAIVDQRMMAYSKEDMKQLFKAAIPDAEHVWTTNM